MPEHKATFLVWIFVMRILMILTSIVSYVANAAVARSQNTGKDKINFEARSRVWCGCARCCRSSSRSSPRNGCSARSAATCGSRCP
jgi:hypothetical protein